MEHNSDFKYDLQLGLKGEGLVADMLSNKKIEVKTDFQAKDTGNKLIKLNINLKDASKQNGKDVSINVDTWKPDAEAPKADASSTSNDLPF